MSDTVINIKGDLYGDPKAFGEKVSREMWLAERRKGVGASEVASIIAPEVAYEGPLALWMKKTGRYTKDDATERMTSGRYHEPAVAAWFADEYQCQLQHAGNASLVSPVYPHLRATPDYYVTSPERGRGVVECKCRFHHAEVEEFSGEVPTLKWQIQVQSQMAVTGCRWGAVAALVVGEHMAWAMGQNDEFIARTGEAVEAWWEKYVVTDTPPPDDTKGVAEWLCKYIPPKRSLVTVELDDVAAVAAIKLESLRLARLEAERLEDEAKEAVIKAIGTGADVGTAPGVRYSLLLRGKNKNRTLKLEKNP